MTSPNVPSFLPKIDEDNVMDSVNTKQRITEILDLLEGKVEKLRKEASKLEEDRDNILASLDSLRTADWTTNINKCEYALIRRSFYMFIFSI